MTFAVKLKRHSTIYTRRSVYASGNDDSDVIGIFSLGLNCKKVEVWVF